MENITMPTEAPSWSSTLPPEVQVLIYYLNPKLRGEPIEYLPGYMIEIKRDDLYGTHPRDIFSTYARDEWQCKLFFFTTPPPNKENRNIKLCNIGAWKVAKSLYPIPIEDPRLGNQLVGFWRVYRYEDNSNSDQRPPYWWLLTEYITLQTPKVPSLDYVFCTIDQIEYDYDDWEVLLTCAAAAA